jgi:hypothetical protein
MRRLIAAVVAVGAIRSLNLPFTIMEGATPTFMPDCDVVVIADWCGKRLDQRELLGLQNLCWRQPRT